MHALQQNQHQPSLEYEELEDLIDLQLPDNLKPPMLVIFTTKVVLMRIS